MPTENPPGRAGRKRRGERARQSPTGVQAGDVAKLMEIPPARRPEARGDGGVSWVF